MQKQRQQGLGMKELWVGESWNSSYFPQNTGNMSNVSDEIDFQIYGDDMQTVEVELDPGETVVAEAGAMNWMEEGIRFEARMGDGSAVASGFFGSLLGAGKRILTGESLFMTHFTNDGIGKGRVAFASPYPGKIMPIQLAELGVKSSAKRMRFCARHVAQRCPSRSTSVWGRVSSVVKGSSFSDSGGMEWPSCMQAGPSCKSNSATKACESTPGALWRTQGKLTIPWKQPVD